MIQPLNLPKALLQLKRKQDDVFVNCLVRKTELLLTPEEWVRQHILNALNDAGISLGRIMVENGLKYNQLTKRTDVVVVDSFGQPFLIVECKAPKVSLTIDTFQQWSNYQNTLKASFGLLTNGLSHVFINVESKEYTEIENALEFKNYVLSNILKGDQTNLK
ncbi:MAG: type I restriction enzyme HsdR N-terminal domain-containing protein [Bacteroidetes bacterium]|nr:type I restriction enzyme HsdR N-terminal domain-containing protein [Bacteroidota bacterium]